MKAHSSWHGTVVLSALFLLMGAFIVVAPALPAAHAQPDVTITTSTGVTVCPGSLGGTWSGTTCTISGTLTIPSGETLNVGSGVTVVATGAGGGAGASGSDGSFDLVAAGNGGAGGTGGAGGPGVDNGGTIYNSGTINATGGAGGIGGTGGQGGGSYVTVGCCSEIPSGVGGAGGTGGAGGAGGPGVDNGGTIHNSGTINAAGGGAGAGGFGGMGGHGAVGGAGGTGGPGSTGGDGFYGFIYNSGTVNATGGAGGAGGAGGDGNGNAGNAGPGGTGGDGFYGGTFNHGNVMCSGGPGGAGGTAGQAASGYGSGTGGNGAPGGTGGNGITAAAGYSFESYGTGKGTGGGGGLGGQGSTANPLFFVSNGTNGAAGTGGAGIYNAGTTLYNYGAMTGGGGLGGLGLYGTTGGVTPPPPPGINGGNGGPGIVVSLYGTIASSGTVSATGGTGGGGQGTPINDPAGSGGGGASGIYNLGTIASSGTVSATGGTGGYGGYEQNTGYAPNGAGGIGIDNHGTIDNSLSLSANGGLEPYTTAYNYGISNSGTINDYCSTSSLTWSSYTGPYDNLVQCGTAVFTQDLSGIQIPAGVSWGVDVSWGPFLAQSPHNATGPLDVEVQAVGLLTYTVLSPAVGPTNVYACVAGCSGSVSISNTFDLVVTFQSVSSATNVACSASQAFVGTPLTCTATVLGQVPTGTVAFAAYDSPGTFSPASGVCNLSPSSTSSTCSVTFTPTSNGGDVLFIASYSGDTANGPGYGYVELTLNAALTATSVSCSPASVGQDSPTTCTATVTGDSPTGTAYIFTGSDPYGSFSPSAGPDTGDCTLSPSGFNTASCSVTYTRTAQGTVPILATYAGDANNGYSQGMFSLTVTKAASTSSVSCSPSTVDAGSPTTCTDTVTGLSPTGDIAFSALSSTGSFPSGSQCTLVSGSCSVTYTDTAAGSSPTVYAYYGGDSNNFQSYGVFTLTVKPATTTSLSCSPTSVQQGFTSVCDAYVKGSLSAPTGTVTFTSSSSGGGFYPESGGVTFTPSIECTLIAINSTTGVCGADYADATAGTPTITASYGGDSSYAPSSASFSSLIVVQLTATSVSCSPAYVPGDGTTPTTCTATVAGAYGPSSVTPTGTVSFISSSSGGTFSPSTGQCALVSGSCSVTYTDSTVGSSEISASYSGDPGNTPSSGQFPLTVTTISTTSVACSPASIIINDGTSTTCTATVRGSSPTGTVTFSTSSTGLSGGGFTPPTGQCTLSPVNSSSGSCFVTYFDYTYGTPTITASYAGDSGNTPSSGTFSLTVLRVATTTTVSCSPTEVTSGSSTTCTAEVAGQLFSGYGPFVLTVDFSSSSPTGAFSSSGQCTLSFPPLVNYGTCSVTYSDAAMSPATITASYPGDAVNAPSFGTFSLAGPTTTTSLSCSPSLFVPGSYTTCTVSVVGGGATPTGVVNFTSSSPSGSFTQSIGIGTFNPLGQCTLVSGSCSIPYTDGSTGTPTITASYLGDANNLASSGTFVLSIKSSVDVIVSCSPDPLSLGSTATCIVYVAGLAAPTPTGVVYFTSDSPTGSFTPSAGQCTLSPAPYSEGICSFTYTDTSAGDPTVTVSFPGDSNYAPGSGLFAFTIPKATTTTVVSCTPSQFLPGSSTTCTATVTGLLPTGNFSFYSSSPTGTFSPHPILPYTNPFAGECTISASDSCSVTYTDTTLGSPTITAVYSSDSNNWDSVGTTSVTVGQPVSAGTLSATSNPVEVGQQTTISTSGASGGTGPYNYAWTNLPPGCSSSDSASVSCTPSSALGSPFTITLTVTDSNGNTATATLPLTVDPALAVPAPSVTQNPADVGQLVTFTASPTGGSGIYDTYVWTGLPSGCTASSSATVTCTPTSSSGSPLSVSVAVTDSNGAAVTSGSLSFFVFADPTVAVTPAGPLSYGAGQAASALSALVSYSGPNTASLEWYSSASSSCSSSSTATGISGTSFTPHTDSVGTTFYCAVVSDSGVAGYQSSSNAVEVVVSPALAVSISPTTASIDADGVSSATFTAVTAGGSGGNSYSWSYTGLTAASGCGPTDASCTVTASTMGTFTVSATVTDSSGAAGTSNAAAVTVSAALGASISPSTASIDADGVTSAAFSLTPSGGSGGDSYSWSLGSGLSVKSGCASADTSCVVTSTTPGSSSVSATVTDSNGGTATTSQATVTVSQALTASVSPVTATIYGDGVTPATFTLTTVGGSGGNSYSWSHDGLSVASGCGPTDTTCVVTAGTPGAFTISVTATDSNGGVKASNGATLTAVKRSTSTAVACSPSPGLTGSPVSCTVTVTDTSAGTLGTPTGVVAFSSAPVFGALNLPTSCTLSATATTGTANCSVSFTPSPGSQASYTVAASYGGDSDHQTSGGGGTLVVEQPGTTAQASSTTTISGGVASSDQTSTTGVDVTISGSSAPTGTSVTITTEDLSSPSQNVGVSSLLGTDYYDVSVVGITGGTANVCITSSSSAPSTLEYWTGASWAVASGTTVSGDTICGSIPVSALTGANVVIGTPRTTITSLSCAPSFVVTSSSGSSVTCTATVTDTSPSPVAPQGTVTFAITSPSSPPGSLDFPSSDSCTLATVAGSPGVAACSLAAFSPSSGSDGSYTVTASYPGSASYGASSGSSTFLVTPSSGVSVYLTCDQTTLKSGQHTNCHATIYTGDSGYPGGLVAWSVSPSGSGAFSHQQCDGQAPAGPGPAKNPVHCVVQFTPAVDGAQAVTVTYSNDPYHGGGHDTFTVFTGASSSPGTTLTLTCDQNYPSIGQNDNCHAVVTSADGAALSGTVTWSAAPTGGSFGKTQCSDGKNGQMHCDAQFTPNAPSPSGEYTVTAAYSETGGHTPSSDEYVVYVTTGQTGVPGVELSQIPTSLALTCDQSTPKVGQSVNCTAIVSAADAGALTGTVTWSVSPAGGSLTHLKCDGQPAAGPGAKNPLRCTAQFKPSAAGQYAITATYSGDPYHGPSTHSATIFAGDLSSSASTELALTCDQNYPNVGQNDNCHAVVTSADGAALTGTVTWSANGPGGSFDKVHCDNGKNGQMHCDAQFNASGAGIVVVTATYSEAGGHSSSTDTFVLFVGNVEASGFTALAQVFETSVVAGTPRPAAAPPSCVRSFGAPIVEAF